MRKRIGAFLLMLVMCAALCACGSGKETTTPTAKEPSKAEKAATYVEEKVRSKVFDKYDNIAGVACQTASVKEVEEDRFEVSGKVIAKDKYGDLTWANFDGTALVYDDGDYFVTVNVGRLK